MVEKITLISINSERLDDVDINLTANLKIDKERRVIAANHIKLIDLIQMIQDTFDKRYQKKIF